MIRKSIARAVSSLVTRPVNGAKLSFETVMKKLFANGEQGFWYDPSDMGTMFRDAAGTVPVTAVGQPVGLIRDKSGRNNHAFQTTSASRPILRKNAVTGANYLEFDGSDDFLMTSNINFTSTDKVSLFAGVRKLSDAAVGMLLELSTSSANNGTFSILAPPNAGLARYGVSTRGINTTALQASSAPHPHAAPISSVLTAKLDNAKGDSAANAIKVRHNGENMLASADGLNSTTPANFGDYPLYIGRRAGAVQAFNGHIYGLIGIGKLTSDSETTIIEKELAKRTGVTLP